MALTKVQTIGIETGISLTGVTTVTTLNASTDTLSVGGTVNFGGNVSIAGTLTYEDVTNVDSVGVITARNGIDVTGGSVGIGTDSPVSGVKLHLQDTSACRLQLSTNNTGHTSSDGVRLMIDSSNNFEILNREETNIEFFTNNSERLRITSDGRLLLGLTSGRAVGGATESLAQIETTSQNGLSFVAHRGTNTSGSILILGKSRGTAAGSNTVVASGDELGAIRFAGADGTDVQSRAASIAAFVDGTPGSNDMPGRLTFNTTADGASTPTERMRIDSSGNIGIGEASPGAGLDVKVDTNPVLAIDRGSANTANFNLQYNGTLTGQLSAANADFQISAVGSSTPISFYANGSERMRITSAGFLGLNTSSPATDLHISGSSPHIDLGPQGSNLSKIGFASLNMYLGTTSGSGEFFFKNNISSTDHPQSSGTLLAMITSDRKILVGKSSSGANNDGAELRDGNGGDYAGTFSASGHVVMLANRNTDDGQIIQFRQAGNQEGSISVSGSTVSYNGAHLSRYSQLANGATRTEILRGSVLSNLDEMCEWGDENNEQLNRMKVSDVEGDPKVAGVFQAWDDDDDTYTNDFYCAMTGDFVIRIAQGTTVANGDLLMSAGDGTAKPQDDDIVRSKTIAKVTSTTVSTTYSDGSYCVPCVLMAC